MVCAMTDRSGRTYDEYRELYWAEKKVVKLLRKDIAVLVTTIEEQEATIEQAKSRCNVLIEEDARHLDDIIWIKEALEPKP